MSPSKSDQRINDILIGTKQILDSVKDPLGLVPIPGLPGAVSTLSALIGIILVARGNEGTREDLAINIKALTSVIEETRKTAESVLGTDDDNLTRTRLLTSPELKERVSALEKDLKDLASHANNLEKGFLGLMLSKKNADTLLKIKTGIEDATRKFQIQGGITIEMLINGIVNDIGHIKRTQQQDLDERALKDLPHVNAGYSSALNPTKSGTLQGTRTALLEELMEWCLRPNSNQNGSFIYVVSGGAGTGKSTIAFEMAQRLEEAGALGASFFFIGGANDFNTTSYVLTTIAYQLARSHADLYPHIAKAARDYSRRGKQGEQLQMDLHNLIIKPLMNVQPLHRPIIIVLDALDECTRAAQGEVARLLFLLMERLPELPFPVRVLVTTRPEMHIEVALNTEKLRKVSKPYRLHEIPRVIVDGDIKIFFDARLTELSCWEMIVNARPDVVEELTNLAAGLFIYADTVVKFLGNKPDLAVKILDALLSNNASGSAFSLKNLDRLYIAVLQNALDDDDFDIPDMMKYIQIVLGSLALLQDHVSISGLNDLVDVPVEFIRHILGRLGSVILKPETDDVEIRMLHASFPQFLIDIQRCTDPKFYIDKSMHHRRLTWTCLEVMTMKYPLKRNICELEDPTIMKSNIHGLHGMVKKFIRPSLQYSCVHWVTHLSQCHNPSQNILNAVTEFMRTKLLVWLEVLGYIDRLEVAVPALHAALSWCEVNIQDEDRDEILQLLDDTRRLVLQCYAPISVCPEHLYISALRMAPSCVFTMYYNNPDKTLISNHTTMKSMMPRDSAWGTSLHTITKLSSGCCAMLSPDGGLIASGSPNGEVHTWDASVGSSKRTLLGHTKDVECVAWGPDCQSLASGSADGTIRVWNTTSGAQVHIQRVQSEDCKVYIIAWSQDGARIVTGTKPGGVQVWDIVIGKEMKGRTIPSIELVIGVSKDLGHVVERTTTTALRLWDIRCDNSRILKELPVSFRAGAAVFLHNNTQIAFAGQDNGVHVWDLDSGYCTSKVRLESKIVSRNQAFIYGIVLSSSGNILASSTLDKIHLFDTNTWDTLGSFHGFFKDTASFSPDDRLLVTSFAMIDTWDLSSVLAPKLQITSTSPPLPSSSSSSQNIKHDLPIHFVAVSSEGSRVAAVSCDAVSVWTLQSGALFCVIQGYFLGSVIFSPDAQKIAVAAYNKTCIWDITTTEPTLVRNISTANDANDRITWSRDGRWLAGAVHGPNAVRGLGIFDAVTGKLAKYLSFSNMEKLWQIEFSHDDSMLYAKCGEDAKIFQWKEGKEVDFKLYMWRTERKQKMRYFQGTWIVRERDRKRLCWVQQQYPDCIARWGNYYAVGRASGQLDILHIEEISVNTMEST